MPVNRWGGSWLGRVLPALLVAALLPARAADSSPLSPNPTNPVPAAPSSPAAAPVEGPGDAIFRQPTLVRFRLTLPRESLSALRSTPREYAPATVTIDGREFAKVGVRLKGAAGSFRPIDDQPALTLKFNKWVNGRRWLGLRQVHLNNSVQDSTLMSEYLAGELFRSVGVPAARVAWATVELNGRDLGTYVLKEGFEEEFLVRSFGNAAGNLYDGGFVQDIDQEIERDRGTGPLDRADLRALTRAARERNAAERWRRLQQLLDVNRFVSYAVVSAMIADWDGYAMNRNNYRVYFNPADGRAVFVPHGMDQLFQRDDIGVEPGWSGLVAQGLFSLPEGRRLYHERFRQVFTNEFRLQNLTNLIGRVTEAFKTDQPKLRSRLNWATQLVRNRVRFLEREPDLRGLVPGSEPVVTVPAEGLRPAEWMPQSQGDARLEETESEGQPILRIEAAGPVPASFRASVRLPRGRYRFEGRVRTTGVQAVRDDKGEGAGLRISGTTQARRNHLAGTRGWTPVSYGFELAEDGAEVTLVAELRASRGRAEFDRNSLKVVPIRE